MAPEVLADELPHHLRRRGVLLCIAPGPFTVWHRSAVGIRPVLQRDRGPHMLRPVAPTKGFRMTTRRHFIHLVPAVGLGWGLAVQVQAQVAGKGWCTTCAEKA